MIITAFIDLYPVQLAPPAKLSNDHLRTAGAYSSHGERDGSKGQDFWPTRKPLISTPAAVTWLLWNRNSYPDVFFGLLPILWGCFVDRFYYFMSPKAAQSLTWYVFSFVLFLARKKLFV